MHFSKTYAQLLLTLPPELRESAIQYRQLKKIINEIVAELTSLGLSPDVLQSIIQPPPVLSSDKGKEKEKDSSPFPYSSIQSSGPRIIYELANVADHLEPRLHLYLRDDPALQQTPSSSTPHSPLFFPVLNEPSNLRVDHTFVPVPGPSKSSEFIISLASDAAFFRTLSDALETLSLHLLSKRTEFESTLQALSQDISSAARPSSYRSSFQPHSAFSSDPANISVSFTTLSLTNKSDLDTWRQIFQLYMESDIFQGHQERFRGERHVEDAAARLSAFSVKLQEQLSSGTLKLKLKQSRGALKTFLELNTLILDLQKFQQVTSEATRKILKKHAKRTALPLAPDLTSPFTVNADSQDSSSTPVLARPSARRTESLSLSLLLVQALTETLLPIIPHLDDYSCIICTSLAFKPIRLRCSHLFCVRCLVKLQKRGEQHCPMCRAPTVLSADRSNVDWALLNFMKDWFPMEARKKLQQNQREAAEEEMKELGLDVRSCVVM